MADVVVSVPRQRWRDWIREGSLPGDPSGQRFGFYVKTTERPPVEPGDRVYVIAWDRLRGYAPLIEVQQDAEGFNLIRAGNAVACTLPEPTRAFPGWKVRWWQRADEVAFPDWQTAGVDIDPRPATRSRAAGTLAYAPVVRPRPDKPITPEMFDHHYVAAMREIDSTGSLSWTADDYQRHLHVIRCGEPISRALKCLRPRKHVGECSSKWSAS